MTVATMHPRCSERRIGCRLCIVELYRGHIGLDRHREHRFDRCTSQMRHFLRTTLAPCLLSGGVKAGTAAGLLIACTGSTPRLAPALHRTCLLYTSPSPRD